MSTAINQPTVARLAPHGNTIFWRFVWKEFRMIRGLWAAVAIMGLLVQCAERMLLPGSTDFALTLLYTALAAAVLYTVGAAATTFSVEHEEETYDLLTRLPTTWWPPFAGKLLVTLLSALLLAGILSIPAFMFRAPNFSQQDAQGALGMMGFAIIEAVAWGTLFSLLIKRPLLAAIVTLVVGAVTVNVAVSYSSTYAMATTPTAYVQAMPLRMAIVAAVFACSLLAARGWLTACARSPISSRIRNNERFTTLLAGIYGRVRQRESEALAKRASRRRMLARLLWQAWRECWKLLLAPLGVAVLLLAGIGAAIGLTQVYGEVASFVMASTLLFAPALYGVMVFYADQRRGNYRFLAEHAARPRFTWLARHIVWLGALVAVWLLLIGGIMTLVGTRIEFTNRQMFGEYLYWGSNWNAPNILYGLSYGAEIAARVSIAASFGALVAYGIGQLFSMTVRSEILAAFLALLLSLVIGAWVTVTCLWQLSAVWFLLPLFAGLMLATWLRAPDWIAGRNSFRAWLKPAVAIIAPLVLIAVMLPEVRLAQMRPSVYEISFRRFLAVWIMLPICIGVMLTIWLRASDGIVGRKSFRPWLQVALAIVASFVLIAILLPEVRYAHTRPIISKDPGYTATQQERDRAFADRLAAFQAGDTTEVARTADMYVNAATRLMTMPSEDLLKHWKKPEYLVNADPGSDIDEAKIPPDQLGAFKKAQKQQLERRKQRIASAVNEAIEISKRLTCRFHFDPDTFAPTPRDRPHDRPVAGSKNRTYDNLNNLIGVVAGYPVTEPDQPARRFLAALRMKKHLRSGQPSVVAMHVLNGERIILQRIADWALGNGRTKEELRDVLEELSAEFASPESPAEALLADHLLIRAVIEGKELPFILSTTPIAPHAYLAYLANQLWWERERAQQALDRITKRNIWDLDALTQKLSDAVPRELGTSQLRRWLRPAYDGLPELWEIQEPSAVTSYLVSLEYKARVQISDLYGAYCDNVTSRRATLLQVALALYRLDHEKYPRQLADLVPDYLQKLPLDPYAQQPFQYRPSGLNLPLKYWSIGGNNGVLAANTPLFWSVGAGNAQVKEVVRRQWIDETDEAKPDGAAASPEIKVRGYEFVNEEQGWWNSHPLVFPLSK